MCPVVQAPFWDPRFISFLFWTFPVFFAASSFPPPVSSFHLLFSGTGPSAGA